MIRTRNPCTPGAVQNDGVLFEARQNASWCTWMRLQHLTFSGHHPATGLKSLGEIGLDNGAFESMIVGGSALDGKIRMPGMSRSWIITRKGIVMVM